MRIGRFTRRAAGAAIVGLAMLGAGSGASSAGVAVTVFHHPIAVVGTNQSSNWSGYGQGTVEDGNEMYNSVSGTWIVPKVTQHTAGEAEYSSAWVGIGGGCIDAGCTATDNTLIQAGTEQDVDATGAPSYSAWWEIIPQPSTPVTLAVAPGNKINVTINEVSSGMWTIVIRNLTTRQSVTVNTPYSSTHATAEWIVETPLVIGTGGGFAPLPNLTTVHFDKSLTDGANPSLVSTEQIQLINGSSQVIAAPSSPDSDTEGFNDCTWKASCKTPRS
jgi:hypothetical protein